MKLYLRRTRDVARIDDLIALLLFRIRSVIYLFFEAILHCRRFSFRSQTLSANLLK